jgi:FkbM family methyltransferase
VGIARRVLSPFFRLLPLSTRREIRIRRMERAVRRGKFVSDEHEFGRLHEWLKPGDVALDIGSNFGTFSLRMSELVGDHGRVFAFEPVPQTFAMLTRVLAAANRKNVTALNVACSDKTGFASISIPDEGSLAGEDLYRATLEGSGKSSSLSVCCARLDDLSLPLERLRLVKIDTEQHETAVITGMWQTIVRYKPILIIENLPAAATERLVEFGYTRYHKDKSPNSVFFPKSE